MSQVNAFPSWLLDVEKSAGGKLNKNSRDFFSKAMECYPYFYEVFLNCPNKLEIGQLNELNPHFLETYYGKQAVLIPFIVANIFECFHFEFVYQIRELAISQREALERGAFYVAVILSRSIFETICTQYYTVRRVDEKFKQLVKWTQEAAKTNSKVEQEKLLRKSNEVLYEIFSLVFSARASTSLDWAAHMSTFGFQIENAEKIKPIHVSKAVEDLENASKLPLIKTYSLLSEFVHPNFGAKTLILNTKQPYQPYMDKMTLGENINNHEAALWYLDQLSESLYYSLTLACSLHEMSVKFLNAIFSLAGINDKQSIN
jgi:hypothetical protein